MSQTHLLGLPNEVLERIFHLVLPHEVLDGALSCRFLNGVAKPLLKRFKELAGRYEVLYFGYEVEGVQGLESPIGFLEMVLRDPDTAYWPRVVQVLEYNDDGVDDEDYDGNEGNGFEGREREEGIVQMLGEGIGKLVRDCPYLSEEEYDNWTTAILEQGNDDPALAILFSLLPNLKEIVIWLHHRSLPYTSTMISRISQSTSTSASSSPDKTHPLSKLQSLRLGQRGDNAVNGLSFTFPFLSLPSITQISGQHIKSDSLFPNTTDLTWPPPHPSTIKTLSFEQSTVSPAAIFDLVSGIKALRTFFYEADGNAESADSEGDAFAPGQVVKGLERYAGRSLEELHFVVRPDWMVVEPWHHIPSLRAFAKLRVVEIEAEFLCRSFDDESVSEEAKPLVDILPKTIEALALRHLRLEQAELLFEGFREGRERGIPGLKSLVLRHPDHGNNVKPVLEVVRMACEGTGVDIGVESERGGFPFYEAGMGTDLVERLAICERYPRKWE